MSVLIREVPLYMLLIVLLLQDKGDSGMTTEEAIVLIQVWRLMVYVHVIIVFCIILSSHHDRYMNGLVKGD